MVMQYLLIFCRISTGLVFTWSFVGKVQNVSSFIQTINHLKLLPKALHRPLAVVLLGGELTVLVAMLLGGELLVSGFLLAGLLLIFFSIVLALALARQIRVSCNCFGLSQNSISSFDIVRNTILLLLSFGGYTLSLMGKEKASMLSWPDWALIGVAAIIFVTILVSSQKFGGESLSAPRATEVEFTGALCH